MSLWGSRRSGGNSDSTLNFVAVYPGDDYYLLDGTETIVTGSLSAPFARAMSGSDDAGTSFVISGCTNGTVTQIQVSNGVSRPDRNSPSFTLADLDATFQDTSGGGLTGNGAQADTGRSAFYRIKVTTFVSGDAPVVIAKR